MTYLMKITRPHRWEARPVARDTCQRTLYQNGAAVICGAPSHGKTYCPECRERAIQAPLGSRFPSVRGHRFQL